MQYCCPLSLQFEIGPRVSLGSHRGRPLSSSKITASTGRSEHRLFPVTKKAQFTASWNPHLPPWTLRRKSKVSSAIWNRIGAGSNKQDSFPLSCMGDFIHVCNHSRRIISWFSGICSENRMQSDFMTSEQIEMTIFFYMMHQEGDEKKSKRLKLWPNTLLQTNIVFTTEKAGAAVHSKREQNSKFKQMYLFLPCCQIFVHVFFLFSSGLPSSIHICTRWMRRRSFSVTVILLRWFAASCAFSRFIIRRHSVASWDEEKNKRDLPQTWGPWIIISVIMFNYAISYQLSVI